MSWDTELLPVPEIPYESDLYNDAEDAVVSALDADGYLSTVTGDGGISRIEARPILMNDLETLFANVGMDDLPAIYVDAQSKAEDYGEEAGAWFLPIQLVVAVVQAASDLTILDNNTKRRLGEVERCLRQIAGVQGTGFWINTRVEIGPTTIMVGLGRDNAFMGVGWLTVTVHKMVLNRLEAL